MGELLGYQFWASFEWMNLAIVLVIFLIVTSQSRAMVGKFLSDIKATKYEVLKFKFTHSYFFCLVFTVGYIGKQLGYNETCKVVFVGFFSISLIASLISLAFTHIKTKQKK